MIEMISGTKKKWSKISVFIYFLFRGDFVVDWLLIESKSKIYTKYPSSDKSFEL